jgi:hypothetical protein
LVLHGDEKKDIGQEVSMTKQTALPESIFLSLTAMDDK